MKNDPNPNVENKVWPRGFPVMGYSLVELLVVLAIMGILALVGIATLGDRKGSSVRSVMDQVEGTIMQAQKNAMATGQDVYLAANGTWTGTGVASLTNAGARLTIDPRRLDPADTTTPINAFTHARIGAESEVFQSLFRSTRDHMHAGIATDATVKAWADSLAAASPFTADASAGGDIVLAAAFTEAYGNNLCNGSKNTAIVNGVNYRFQAGFCLVVVGLLDGQPDAAGPIGVIVVPRNSANVYRFYRRAGEGVWQRI